MLVFAILIAPLLCPATSSAQWKKVFAKNGWISSIYFLDLSGAPRIGFAVDYDSLFKTTDGGTSWREIALPQLSSSFDFLWSDFTFKDSVTGWVSYASGDPTSVGVFKTTDQGDSWQFQSSFGSESGIFYDSLTDGLFLTGWGAGNSTYVSWDEGNTWQPMTGSSGDDVGGFAFANLDAGVMTNPTASNQPPYNWWRTFDGGHIWNQCAIDSECYQPLAISGTQTYFGLTFNGTVLRTDDSWDTWQILYQFPWPNSILRNTTALPASSCIRGTLNNLIVQTGLGLYRSTDQGYTWNYLCGPVSNYVNFFRFFVMDNFIYCASVDILSGLGSLWMLDLNSLQSPKPDFSSSFSKNAKQTTISAGDTLKVYFHPLSDFFPDSAHFTISYDPDVLSWKSAELPTGWTMTSSNTPGLLDLICVNGSQQNLQNETISVSFNTILSKLSSEIVIERAQVLSHEFSSECLAENLPPPDTLQFSFIGCGDSALLQFMKTGEFPFTIQSVSPNPTTASLKVRLATTASAAITYELFDALGRTALQGTFSGATSTIYLHTLPNGSYYLRLTQNGFVQSRRVVVER